MKTFALITEGPTDQAVIENILNGYFNKRVKVNRLQPPDETDKSRANFGGWELVLNYCETEITDALDFHDYIIIHIDTDDIINRGLIKSYEHGKELTPDAIILQARALLLSKIDDEWYTQNKNKIIFAIAVHSIECWLLPLYCPKKKAGHTKGCFDRLKRCLHNKKELRFYNKKTFRNYQRLSKNYNKQKSLMNLYRLNPSLSSFVKELEVIKKQDKQKPIVMQDDDDDFVF